MKVTQPSVKKRAQLNIDISIEDHALIKVLAAESRMPMKVWIINAMAEKIRRDTEIKKQDVDTFIKELWPS